MKPLEHIDRLLADTHAVQADGHCSGNAPAFVAVNDIEIAVHDLRRAFEEKINNDSEGANRKELICRMIRILGRIIRRFPFVAIVG